MRWFYFFAAFDENGELRMLTDEQALDRIKQHSSPTLLLEVELPFTTLKYKDNFDILEFDAEVSVLSLRRYATMWQVEIEITADLIGVQLKAYIHRIIGNDAVKIYRISPEQTTGEGALPEL